MVKSINPISFQGQFNLRAGRGIIRDALGFKPAGEVVEGKNLQPKSKKALGCWYEGCSNYLPT